MKTIVITGGPCSGKTSAMEYLHARFADEGMTTVFVDEAGTDLINGGTTPGSCGSMLAFQTQVAALQVEREAEAQRIACQKEHELGHEILIICDRGIADGLAYVGEQGYDAVLKACGLTREDAYARYDAVFCLESTAKMSADAYTVANNVARSETADEAAALDNRTAAAWASHPHFTFITNEDSFSAKAENLYRAITNFLG